MENGLYFNEAIQSLHEAESAVVKAQNYSCPEYLQFADQKLKVAYQRLHEAQGYTKNEEQKKRLHHAKERLKHLQENQDSLQY